MESKQEEKEEGRKVPNLLCTVARMSVCESNSSILSKMAWIQHKQPFVAACLTHEQTGCQAKPSALLLAAFSFLSFLFASLSH